jgi:hypothetical protein
MNPYTAYEYLSFILPGGLITSVAFYGYFGWPYSEPGGTYLVGILAVAFVVGHLNAGLASWIEPGLWGDRPGGRTDSTWGMFGKRGPYDEEDRPGVEADVCNAMGESPFRTAYNLGFTELRRQGQAGFLDILNSQIGLYRNLAVACGVCSIIVVGYNATDHQHLPLVPWLPILLVAAVVFTYRYRRFWVRFGDYVVRGVRRLGASELPPKQTQP